MKLLGNEVPTQEEFDVVVNDMNVFKTDSTAVMQAQGQAIVHTSAVLENHKKTLMILCAVSAFNVVVATAAAVWHFL